MNARCAFHPAREASALCIACGHTYCRECVTESAGRVYCLRCLTSLAAASTHGARGLAARAAHSLLGAAGVAVLFAVFFLLLRYVAAIPAEYLLRSGHGG
ncbi:MAG TPA: hypothetical protein VN709_04195 [Terriglobales bacterium]|nr:hypothetical protein [Terriglobales bacterium]